MYYDHCMLVGTLSTFCHHNINVMFVTTSSMLAFQYLHPSPDFRYFFFTAIGHIPLHILSMLGIDGDPIDNLRRTA